MRGDIQVSSRSFAFVSARLRPSVLLIGVLIGGCGGDNPCSVAGEHDFIAMRTEATTSAYGTCTDLPQTIAVHLSLRVENSHAAGTITEASVAHPIDYSTDVNVCFVDVAWYERGLVSHNYVLDLGDYSYLTIARNGVCMARYELR